MGFAYGIRGRGRREEKGAEKNNKKYLQGATVDYVANFSKPSNLTGLLKKKNCYI